MRSLSILVPAKEDTCGKCRFVMDDDDQCNPSGQCCKLFEYEWLEWDEDADEPKRTTLCMTAEHGS